MPELRRRRARQNTKKMIEYSNSQIAALIDEYIHSERDRAILKRRLIDGITYDELSAEFSISVRHIKTIVYKGQDRLFRRIVS